MRLPLSFPPSSTTAPSRLWRVAGGERMDLLLDKTELRRGTVSAAKRPEGLCGMAVGSVSPRTPKPIPSGGRAMWLRFPFPPVGSCQVAPAPRRSICFRREQRAEGGEGGRATGEGVSHSKGHGAGSRAFTFSGRLSWKLEGDRLCSFMFCLAPLGAGSRVRYKASRSARSC